MDPELPSDGLLHSVGDAVTPSLRMTRWFSPIIRSRQVAPGYLVLAAPVPGAALSYRWCTRHAWCVVISFGRACSGCSAVHSAPFFSGDVRRAATSPRSGLCSTARSSEHSRRISLMTGNGTTSCLLVGSGSPAAGTLIQRSNSRSGDRSCEACTRHRSVSEICSKRVAWRSSLSRMASLSIAPAAKAKHSMSASLAATIWPKSIPSSWLRGPNPPMVCKANRGASS